VQKLAETAIDMLIATRNVIAKNQELINRDPISGNYYFKGFVPAVVGTQIANDFTLVTGYKLKQTSLRLRNPANAPDEWEKKVLKKLQSSGYSKGVGFGETLETENKKIYRYMKPIYAERACLECHGEKDKIKPAIRQFLERKYPGDEAFGYKEGDIRGGISIIIPLEQLGF
jgi:methyl-accepting chemotaxis protein